MEKRFQRKVDSVVCIQSNPRLISARRKSLEQAASLLAVSPKWRRAEPEVCIDTTQNVTVIIFVHLL